MSAENAGEIRDSRELLDLVVAESMYEELLTQLNKDLSLSNSGIAVPLGIAPAELVDLFCDELARMAESESGNLSNLLYTVDIPENLVYKISRAKAAEQVPLLCFHILKRIWVKIWLRKRYNP